MSSPGEYLLDRQTESFPDGYKEPEISGVFGPDAKRVRHGPDGPGGCSYSGTGPCPLCNESIKVAPSSRQSHLPVDAKERKKIPLYSGLVKYFPDALVEVARVSQRGNDQHNPGEPLHWARGKSMDQEDTLLRHLFDAGTLDADGLRHSAKVAWRALAMLQLEIERER